jgi:UDP-N-acetyl-D-mannosaminuronate dehydrogenase
MNEAANSLLKKIQSHDALVGIIGLGYVGLPLALCFAEKGFKVLGFDVDPAKVEKLNRGECYIKHLDQLRIKDAVDSQRFLATSDFDRLSEPDAILICVPTPLGAHKEPDLSYVENSTKSIEKTLRKGQLIILESTTYPGTTDELLREILESSISEQNTSGDMLIRRVLGQDYFLAFSPEREDPGNANYGTKNIPKVVGGVDEISGDLAQALYGEVLDSTVRVKNARTAEASKLVENIFRAVNIALVNELKMIFEKMDVDIWDVLDAAETKPFGFMRFNPGPGLGGHCLAGDQVVRVRGRGLDGEYALEDLYRCLRVDSEAVITTRGMYLDSTDLEVVSLEVVSGRIGWAPVECLYRGRFDDRGYRIEATSGASIVATAEHPMLKLADDQWVTEKACALRVGDRLPLALAAGDDEQAQKTVVSKVQPIDLPGVVYSLEVKGTATFATSGGICVHNCIPLDPFYLAWKAKECGQPTRFIELAGEINTQMPHYVVEKVAQGLNDHGKAMKGAKVLVLGLAYKPDIDDPRESPAFEVIDLLLERGAHVSYHDPHIPVAPRMRSWPRLPAMESVALSPENMRSMDAAIVVTNHKGINYNAVQKSIQLVIDTRGVFRTEIENVKKA